MKGLFKRFSEYAERRLRLSQICILYQNQSAIEFLLDQFQSAPLGSDTIADEMLESIGMFKLYVGDCIVELSYSTTLNQEQSNQLYEINKGLRNIYGGLVEGKRRARAMFGESAEGLAPFEQRFVPASGWDNFSDSEWDKMLNKALDQH